VIAIASWYPAGQCEHSPRNKPEINKWFDDKHSIPFEEKHSVTDYFYRNKQWLTSSLLELPSEPAVPTVSTKYRWLTEPASLPALARWTAILENAVEDGQDDFRYKISHVIDEPLCM